MILPKTIATVDRVHPSTTNFFAAEWRCSLMYKHHTEQIALPPQKLRDIAARIPEELLKYNGIAGKNIVILYTFYRVLASVMRTAIDILAEIGINMQQFPAVAHLASRARICPGNQENADKRLSGKKGLSKQVSSQRKIGKYPLRKPVRAGKLFL